MSPAWSNIAGADQYVRMGIDAMTRGRDGIESGLLGYALEQISRASYYMSEAAFRLQTQILVEAKDHETNSDKKGKLPCPEPNHVTTKPEISGSLSGTSSRSGKETPTSAVDASDVEKSSKCPSVGPATPTEEEEF